MPLNPKVQPFVLPPLNPEEENIPNAAFPSNASRKAFERAVRAANPEVKANTNLEAFLAWAQSQKTKKRKQSKQRSRTRGRSRRYNRK